MGRALGIGIVCAPVVSAALLGLGWAWRAICNRPTRRNSQ